VTDNFGFRFRWPKHVRRLSRFCMQRLTEKYATSVLAGEFREISRKKRKLWNKKKSLTD